jgi:hypothetical protein
VEFIIRLFGARERVKGDIYMEKEENFEYETLERLGM